MLKRQTMCILGISSLVLAGAASQGSAGVINSYNGPTGGGLGSAPQTFLTTPNPNNDNATIHQPPSTNSFHVDKRFDHFAPIDLRFTVHNSGGTTEYFILENVSNNSGVNWLDYHIQIGFGTGSSFQLSTGGLDVDAPHFDPTPTAPYFTTLDHQASAINWSDGTWPANPGAGWNNRTITYSIDVPDFNASIPASAAIFDANHNVIGYQFTVRQYPTVPEPSSMILLGTGLAGLCGSGWRKWKQGKSAAEAPAPENAENLPVLS